MKKYIVRVEVLKTVLQYVDMEISAINLNAAKEEAVRKYERDGTESHKRIDSGSYTVELDMDDYDNWNVEEEWEPKKGDLIEVSSDDESWCLRTFITMTQDGRFVCWVRHDQEDVFIWNSGRSAKCR